MDKGNHSHTVLHITVLLVIKLLSVYKQILCGLGSTENECDVSSCTKQIYQYFLHGLKNDLGGSSQSVSLAVILVVMVVDIVVRKIVVQLGVCLEDM